MERRYLITGAQGFVGRYLTARILGLEDGSQVLGIGRSGRLDGFFTHAISTRDGQMRAPLPGNLLASFDARFRYQQVSLFETARLREILGDFQPHCIFHLASGLSTASKRDLIQTNIEGTASLMDVVADAPGGQALVILGSSGGVYGETTSLPISESSPCNPADLYGATKLAAEHITRIQARRSGFAFITARIFNIVGPGQAESHVCGRFAAQLASSAPSGGGVLRVGQLDTTRDFIDVRDLADALLLLAHSGEDGGTYNLASGDETPIRFVLSELLRISRSSGRLQIASGNDRPAGINRHFADVTRLQRLGFVARYSLRSSLADLFRYYRTLPCSAPVGGNAEVAARLR